MLRKLATVSAFALAAVSGAFAQNFSLPPSFGELALPAGFPNDPRAVAIQAGGTINAIALPNQLGGNCTGFIADAPDYRVQYTSGSWPLIFSAYADADVTLVINGPNGQWYCNDDTNGLNPAVRFDTPMSGQYDIWVGTFLAGPLVPAVLYVSEVSSGPFEGVVPGQNGGTLPSGLAPGAMPAFGSAVLNAGFAPDPHLVSLQAGGSIDASTVSAECRGFVASAPDYRLTYTPGPWQLYITATSQTDTTLVVQLPNGQFLCDDDSGGNFNPRVAMSSPLAGVYNIWVGTYSSTAGSASATLRISELN